MSTVACVAAKIQAPTELGSGCRDSRHHTYVPASYFPLLVRIIRANNPFPLFPLSSFCCFGSSLAVAVPGSVLQESRTTSSSVLVSNGNIDSSRATRSPIAKQDENERGFRTYVPSVHFFWIHWLYHVEPPLPGVGSGLRIYTILFGGFYDQE